MLAPVFVLDALVSVAQAREALAAVPQGAWVVVRREHPDGSGRLLFYPVYRDDLAALLLRATEDATALGVLLDLHEHLAAPTGELADPAVRSGSFTGVVVRGGRPVAYAASEGAGGAGRPPRRTRSLDLPDSRSRTGRRTRDQPGPAPPGGSRHPRAAQVLAYPRVEVPAELAPRQTFEVQIGLSDQRQTGSDERMTLAVEPSADHLEVVIQVVADGFAAPRGIRRILMLPKDDLTSATVRVPLVAPALAGRHWRGRVEVEYSVGGVLTGRAWREVLVRDAAAPDAPPSSSGGSLPVVQPRGPIADLTVSITEGTTPGRLLWTFTSAHPLDLPDEQVTTSLKTGNARAFAQRHIQDLARTDGTQAAESRVEGVSRIIASATPVAFWTALTAVWSIAKAAKRRPTLLVVSSDAYIPWELASTEPRWVTDRTLVDRKAPQMLGAQVHLGRWTPAGPDTPSGTRVPPVAPEPAIEVARMAVVVGDYHSDSGVRPLPQAVAEGAELADTYPSVTVAGTLADLTALLNGRPTSGGDSSDVQVVHLACHGAVDRDHPAYNGIVLSDTDLRIDDVIVLGGELGSTGAPLVFLNACQLGQTTDELLGDQGGLAEAFLGVGARGFLAPLWSVDDAFARQIALDFYRYTLLEGRTVGEALRLVRGLYATVGDRTQSTPLAYAYYGHPDLRLTLAH